MEAAVQPDGVVHSHVVSEAGKTPRPALTHAELRSLVRYWVGMLKGAGFPAEEVLIAVKSLVRETIVPRYSGYAEGHDETSARIAFVRDAAQWCIDAYYEDDVDDR